jgi:zinc protease
MIKEHFEKIPAAVNPKPRIKYTHTTPYRNTYRNFTDPEQPYNVVQVYYTQPQAPVAKTETQYRSYIVRELFNQMMSSRLDEIAQKPEAPFLFGNSGYGGFIGDKMHSVYCCGKTGKDINASIQTLLTENERVKQYGFVQTELDRAVKNMMSRIENMYNERDKTKSAELVQELVGNYFKGEAISGYRL